VDVTHATDHPNLDKKEYGDVRLGAGPVLSRGAVVNGILLKGLREAAEGAGLPIQLVAAPSATGTDADSIFTSRAGVATAIVSVPNRYMHSPNQLVDVSDVEGAAELIASYLAGLEPEQSFIPD
jgi:endoglucanase